MADQDDGGEIGTDLVPLPDLRRIEPLLKRLPQVRENLKKVMARVFGSPQRTRSMAGAQSTADSVREGQEALAVILRAAAERAASDVAAGGDPELAHRAITRQGEEAVRAQMNIEKTVSMALHDAPSIIGDADTDQSLNDDWLARWIRLAETISEEDVQRLWGRVLVGESYRPGSFSPITLHTLSIMTPGLAGTFERLCNLSIAGLDTCPGVAFADDEDGAQPLGKFGVNFDELLTLQSSGLISSIYTAVYRFDGDASTVEFDFAGKRARVSARDGTLEGEIPIIPFSPAATEIRELIVLRPNTDYTRMLTMTFDRMGIDFTVVNDG